MIEELDLIRLAVIPVEQAQYFERDDLFGADFQSKASAQIDAEIKAAGNCLAAGLNTAAVFHFMRAAEAGMRALASFLGVPVTLKYPIEYAEWSKVIEEISKALERPSPNTVPPPGRGQLKDAELEFCNGLLMDLNYFKDAYRNPVAHLRGDYDLGRALVVYADVKRFMLRLAPRVPLK